MTDYAKRAVGILHKIRYATLATVCEDGRPWNSPVAHEYDSQLNIYWFSDKQNQHSQNARNSGEVFIVIYDSTVPEGDGEGVYIQAKVTELSDPEEILRVRKIKKGEDYAGSPNDFQGDAIRRVYKAEPQRVWMNDAEVTDGVFIRDYRVEIPLATIQGLLNE
jgi:hypothetical protein